MKIKYKILLITVLVSLGALMIIGFTSYHTMKRVLIEEVSNKLIAISEIQKVKLNNLIEQNAERLTLISSRTQLRISLNNYIKSGDRQNINKIIRILNDAKVSIRNLNTISVLTLDGKVVASTDSKEIAAIYKNEEFFIRGQNENVTDLFYLSKNTELMMQLSSPLTYNNQLIGIILINANADKITSFVSDYSGLGETGYTRIIKKYGDTYMVSAHRSEKPVNIYFSDKENFGLITKQSLQKGMFVFKDIIDISNQRVIAVSNFIENADIGISVRISHSEAFSNLFYLKKVMILVITLSVILIIIFSLFFSNSLAKPIIHLSRLAEDISKGDLNKKIAITSHDEIGLLAKSFNKMSENLLLDINRREIAEKELVKTEKERATEFKKSYNQIQQAQDASLNMLNDLNDEITERERAEQIQKVLYNISNAVNFTKNLDGLIKIIQKELGTLIDTTNFFVAIYDKKTDTILLPYIADEKDDHTSFPAGKTLTAYVIKTKKPLLATKKVMAELELSGKIETVGSDSEIWLGVPMTLEGKVTGAIVAQSYDNKNAYNLHDMEILEFVSHVISISINRKKTDEELKATYLKAAESDRLKSAFLATMSHELRTPLNAVIGFSDIINEGVPMKDIVMYNKTINSSGKHLLSIVEDIFDITLIESGQINITKEDVRLQSILNDVQEIIKMEQFKLNKTHLNLKLMIPPTGKDLIIHTDASKLKQILINLLKNALKFTHTGHIDFGYSLKIKKPVTKRPVLSLSKERQSAEVVTELGSTEPVEVEFFVKDTGIGIPEDKKEYIFESFRQIEETYTKTFGGAGIGLSISKRLIELLAGKIWLKSKLGKGSTFYFTIPHEKSDVTKKVIETETKNEIKNQLKNKTILIVEDAEPSYKFLRIVLEKYKINTLWAKDGEESIKLCKENTNIDLVLMDINMPIMNGYEATKEIKKFKSDLPIIAQTAYAIAGDREESLEAGCNDYISKPIKKEVLIEKIEKFL